MIAMKMPLRFLFVQILIVSFTIAGCAKKPVEIEVVNENYQKTLSIGDNISPFNSDEIYDVVSAEVTDTDNPMIRVKEGGQIKLKDGTHYICETPEGCLIDLKKGWFITEGEIGVYKLSRSHEYRLFRLRMLRVGDNFPNHTVKVKNSTLEERIATLEERIAQLKKENETTESTKVIIEPDKILSAGDSVPDFAKRKRSKVQELQDITSINGKKTVTITLSRGDFIVFGDGTTYICVDPSGCEIRDNIITQGRIAVYPTASLGIEPLQIRRIGRSK